MTLNESWLITLPQYFLTSNFRKEQPKEIPVKNRVEKKDRINIQQSKLAHATKLYIITYTVYKNRWRQQYLTLPS